MGRRLDYQIGITADTSKFQAQMKSVFESLSNVGTSSQVTKELQQASSAALELANNLNKAYNQDTGKLDLRVFENNLKRSGQTLSSYYDQLVRIGPDGQQAFLQVASAVTQAELPIKRSSKLLDQLWVTMKNTMRWQLTSSALNSFTGALQTAYGYSKSLDASLNNIRIVSDKSANDMKEFAEYANKAAKALSATTTDYTNASLIYYQQGLSDEEVLARTDTTIKMANVAGQTAETVSDQMTAVWNNFYDGSKSIEYYADVMVKLGAATASSTDEIAEGIEKFAAISNTVGLSYEYAAAALATVTATTRQSADVVGTAFKTIFARIQDLELGETLDDGTTLGTYSKALEAVGINIQDANGNLRDMDIVLSEMGEKWDTISKSQQVALAEAVAGVRQYNQLIALMDNWDFFKENLDTAYGAEGELNRQADIYAESWKAARDRVTAAAEDIYDSLVNPDFYIAVDDMLTPLLSGIADVIDAAGGLSGVLTIAGTAMMSLYGDKMAQGMRNMVSNLGFMVGYEQIKTRLLQQQAASLVDEIAGQDQVYQVESQMMNIRQQANIELDSLNDYQKQILQSDIDDLAVLEAQVKTLLERKKVSESDIQNDISKIASSANREKANLKAGTTTSKKDQKYISGIFTDYQASGKQITSQSTAVKALAQEYAKVSTNIQRINVVQKAFESNGKKLQKTRQDVKDMGEEFYNTGKQVGLFNTKMSKTEHLEKMEKASSSLQKKLLLLANEMELRGVDTSRLNILEQHIENMTKAAAAAGMSQENFKKKLDATSKAIENQAYKIETVADKIVQTGKVIGQVGMAWSALQNLGRVFTDEDMTTSERLISIFTSLSMILPLVGNAFKGVTKDITAQNVAMEIAAIQAGEKELSDIKNIALRKIVSLAIKNETKDTNGHTVALTAEALAQKAVNGSLLLFIGYAALALVGVAALTAIIYVAVKAYNKEADAAKHAAEAAEQTKEAADEAKTAADNLRSSINAYDSAVEKLEQCARGTEEWRDALKEVNEAAIEVLNNAGKLSAEDIKGLRNSDGSLNREALDNLQETADQRATNLSYAASAAEKYAADAQMRADAMALGRKAYSYRDEYDYGEGDMQVILDNYKELSQLADDELIPALKKLGFNVSDSEETIDTWKTAISDMADNAEAAAGKFNLITQMQVEQVLGEAETTREQAIQAITTSNVDALTQELTKTWEDKLTGSGINKASSSDNEIYKETLKALQDAGYDVSKQTDNAVRGTDSNRSLAFLNSEGKEVVYNAEQIASMIGAAQALDQISEKADIAKAALQNLDEDAISYIASGNLSNVTKEALSKFADEDAIIDLFGGEDAIKNIIAAQEDIDFDEVGTDMVEEFVDGIETAATNAEADFEEVGQGMAHSVQRALEDIDSSDLSLTEFQDIADVFNLAAAYGKLDEAIAAYEAGTLEEFAKGIKSVTSSLEDFKTKYKDTHDIIDDITIGDTISQEDYDKLGEEAQQYFTMMLDGTYKLTENAAEFYEATQKQLIEEAQNNKVDLQERNEAYRNLQGYDFEGLQQNAAYVDKDGNNKYNSKTVQQQVDLIRLLGDQSDTTKEKIQAWQEQLDEGQFDSVDSLQEIADMVGDCGAAYENLGDTIAANEEEARAWDLAIASSYTNLSDLQEALDNDVIGIEAFTAAAVNLDKISDTEMLDAEEWENFADYLQDAASEMEGLNDEMSDNEARIVAKGIMKMNDAIEDLADNFEDWSDIIQNSSEDSEEFADAMGDCRKAVANLLDVSEDFVSNDFIEENLGLIEQAATGSATAIDELKSKLAESIIADIIVQNGLDETTASTILANFQSLRDSIPDIDVGVTLDDGDFLTNAQQLVADAGMTVDQVNALFDAMGFEANFKTEPVLTKQRVPEYVTETRDDGTYTDEDGNTYIRTRTRTYQDGYYEADGYVDAIAMTTNGKTPVISGITRKAGGSYNNYSSRNAGGGSPGGGGGGGSSGKTLDEEKEKTLEDVEDRYHEINRQLERQSDLLDDIDNATDRAYGKDKLAKFQEGIKALEKEQELLNDKLSEAENYLSQDAAAVKEYFSSAQIDANGEITNYEELLRLNMEMYNAEVRKYNLAVAGKTLTDEEAEALKAQLEEAKALFEARQAALEQYESTLDTIRDTTDQIEENARSIADQKLEKIKYKLEIVIDVKSMYDSLRDLEKEIAESFGDALTHGLKSAQLSAEGAQAEAALLPSYRSEYEELKALYKSTTDDADRQAIMDEIQDLQGKVISSAEALVEWANSIEDIVPDAVDAAAERFAKFTDSLDHNTSVLETIKELYALQGVTAKTDAGLATLQKNLLSRLEAQTAQAVLQKQWSDDFEARYSQAQQELDAYLANGGTEESNEYDRLVKMVDAYKEQWQEAEETYLSLAQEAMETAQEMYLNELENAKEAFANALTDGLGFDYLQTKYDNFIEEDERYLDVVNEAYEKISWYNKLQKDIDESTNKAHAEQLKLLQDEINTRKEAGKLSQYDLDVLEAKYKVLQAQIALEDAQNAKNNLQLVRDSQGNWNYQYTADQDQIADAEQNLADAQNEWYNLAKDRVAEVTGEIVAMWQECEEAIDEIYQQKLNGEITEEQYLAKLEEIRHYYKEESIYLENEKQQAIEDINEAGYESLKTTLADSGQAITEFQSEYAEELDTMTDKNAEFADELDKYIKQCEDKYRDYEDTVNDVAENTGTTQDELAAKTDNVSEATQRLYEEGLKAESSMQAQITAAEIASGTYANLALDIWDAVYAMQALAAEQASYAASQAGISSSAEELGYDPNADYSALMGTVDVDSDEYKLYYKWREQKINEPNYDGPGADVSTARVDAFYRNGYSLSDLGYNYFTQISEDEWKKLVGFSTGGYTGTFDDAKLAFLHEKELVLNQEDTANILAAVDVVRTLGPEFFASIERALDGTVAASVGLMKERLNGAGGIQPVAEELQQNVQIEAVFPNVTNHSEIEEAFSNLTNDASQYIRRRRE